MAGLSTPGAISLCPGRRPAAGSLGARQDFAIEKGAAGAGCAWAGDTFYQKFQPAAKAQNTGRVVWRPDQPAPSTAPDNPIQKACCAWGGPAQQAFFAVVFTAAKAACTATECQVPHTRCLPKGWHWQALHHRARGVQALLISACTCCRLAGCKTEFCY